MNAMSSNAPGPRPRQVTIGGWVVAVASLMLVVSVFDTMGNLHSVDTRDQLTRALTSGSAKSLGISLDQALAVVRAALFVAAVAGVVTGILGIFVLQRHAVARIVLTIAAVPVVLTAPFAGGFLGVLIGGSTALLWSRPARDWFAGRPPAPPSQPQPRQTQPTRPLSTGPDGPSAPGSTSAPAAAPTPWPTTGGTAAPTGPVPPPQPTYGWGQQPAGPAGWAPAYPMAPGAPAAAGGTRSVPTQVRVACIITWVFSLVTAGLYLLVAGALLVDRAEMLDLLRDNPAVRDRSLTDDELVTVVVVAASLVVIWCLAACVLAILAWRRHSWAWILLLVSIGVATVVELLALPYTLLHVAAAVTALRLLLVAPTRAWFREGEQPTSLPPGHGGWAPPTGPPLSPPPQQPPGKPPVW